MSRRPAIFGIPVYVLRKGLLPLLVVNGLLVLAVQALPWSVSDALIDLFASSPMLGLAIMTAIGLVPAISCVWFAVRMNRYTKRMKRLNGRACFVCNYEIADGLDACSECGTPWSLSDLNRYWQRNVTRNDPGSDPGPEP